MGRTTAHQRAADWQARGVPRSLWPDVGQQAIESAHRAIWQVTTERLAGNRTTLDVNADSKRPLSIAATISGMGPLLGYWCEQRQLHCDAASSQLLLAHLDHGRRRAFKMETGLTSLLDACRERSVRPTIMKGMFTARRYFPEPGSRPHADIDLLVRPEDLTPTRDALTSIGFRPMLARALGAETWGPGERTASIRSVEVDHADNPWTIDLHTSVDKPYFRRRWSRFGQVVFAVTEPWTVRQRLALVFGQPLLLAYLAHHTAHDINRVRLVRLVELALVMRHDLRLNWTACLKLLEESGVIRFVYPAFALTERLAPGTVDPHFLAAVTAASSSTLQKAVDRLYANPLRAFFRRSPAERLMWANGPIEKLLCWSDIVWPMGTSFRERLRMAKRRMHMALGN